ncbi:MAG: alanine--tRNA ligase [Planctomycetaceae bacterium]|nr:MAG: alanine--tRNA ligase [Planctomycetaceae bacterium]
MKTDEIRERYLAFFESKGHTRRPTDVLVPPDDPTVLFTPAGMNQFKNQFLGVGPLDFTRAATCQMCLRTGDIGNVGVTAYHHTFFEMLGNFSFGDYFKTEAIQWAWEFLTGADWMSLDPDRLSATVFLDDDEAYRTWHDEIGLPESRIRRDDEHENFWPAGSPTNGPDGVCGPCSEIFYDTGEGEPVEIWNLVFTQFNRVGNPPDNLRPLPSKNIDTGMGLERMAAVMQAVRSNFEIDSLRPLCEAAGEVVGADYSFDGEHGRPLRRIADHARAVTFCIHEGVEPGNDKQSYVVRQLLRRAMLEGYLLGQHAPFLHQLVPAVVTAMKAAYPDLVQSADPVANVILEEENQFLDIVERGVGKFEKLAAAAGWERVGTDHRRRSLRSAPDRWLSRGVDRGPLAARSGMTVDRDQFDARMKQHMAGSGSGAFLDSVMAAGPLDELRNRIGGTEFLGYDTTEETVRIEGVIAAGELVATWSETGETATAAVVLDQTPFYGEAGGQVGDIGQLTGDGVVFNITDTQRDGELLLHIGHLESGALSSGDQLTASVDSQRRSGIRRAHSATHLLHHALHIVLGQNAMQRGSKVERDALRFDFAHKQPVTAEEIRRIEDEINARVAEGASVTTEIMALEDARQAGAMALFGEKYPDDVRVVQMGNSAPNCVAALTSRTPARLASAASSPKNRWPRAYGGNSALTGPRALEQIRHTESIVKELTVAMKAPAEDLLGRIESLQEELKDTQKQLQQHSRSAIAGTADTLIDGAEVIDGVRIVAHRAEGVDREGLGTSLTSFETRRHRWH